MASGMDGYRSSLRCLHEENFDRSLEAVSRSALRCFDLVPQITVADYAAEMRTDDPLGSSITIAFPDSMKYSSAGAMER